VLVDLRDREDATPSPPPLKDLPLHHLLSYCHDSPLQVCGKLAVLARYRIIDGSFATKALGAPPENPYLSGSSWRNRGCRRRIWLKGLRKQYPRCPTETDYITCSILMSNTTAPARPEPARHKPFKQIRIAVEDLAPSPRSYPCTATRLARTSAIACSASSGNGGTSCLTRISRARSLARLVISLPPAFIQRS
jgi:hypothetical protein